MAARSNAGRGTNQYQQLGSGASGSPSRSATSAARSGLEQYVAATAPLADDERIVDLTNIDQAVGEEFVMPDPRMAEKTTDPVMSKAWSASPFDRSDAAQDPAASEDVLRRTIKDADLGVRVHTAENPAAPDDVLERAVKDPDAHVRFAAVKNPSASDAVIAAGVTDPDRTVYLAAWTERQTRSVSA